VSRRRRNAAVPAGKLAAPDIAAQAAYRGGMSDAARTLFLVCYDVCKTKMRTRVRKFLMAYKVGGQKSFFECWLTAAELREVRLTLAELIDPGEDRVHIFQLDPRMTPRHAGAGHTAAGRCLSDRLIAGVKR
jgi:CRISPR-associated protein Cas2